MVSRSPWPPPAPGGCPLGSRACRAGRGGLCYCPCCGMGRCLRRRPGRSFRRGRCGERGIRGPRCHLRSGWPLPCRARRPGLSFRPQHPAASWRQDPEASVRWRRNSRGGGRLHMGRRPPNRSVTWRRRAWVTAVSPWRGRRAAGRRIPGLRGPRGGEVEIAVIAGSTPSPQVTLAHSGAHALLDRAALVVIERAVRAVPPPAEMSGRPLRAGVLQPGRLSGGARAASSASWKA